VVLDQAERVAFRVDEPRRQRPVVRIGVDPIDGLDATDVVVAEDDTT